MEYFDINAEESPIEAAKNGDFYEAAFVLRNRLKRDPGNAALHIQFAKALAANGFKRRAIIEAEICRSLSAEFVLQCNELIQQLNDLPTESVDTDFNRYYSTRKYDSWDDLYLYVSEFYPEDECPEYSPSTLSIALFWCEDPDEGVSFDEQFRYYLSPLKEEQEESYFFPNEVDVEFDASQSINDQSVPESRLLYFAEISATTQDHEEAYSDSMDFTPSGYSIDGDTGEVTTYGTGTPESDLWCAKILGQFIKEWNDRRDKRLIEGEAELYFQLNQSVGFDVTVISCVGDPGFENHLLNVCRLVSAACPPVPQMSDDMDEGIRKRFKGRIKSQHGANTSRNCEFNRANGYGLTNTFKRLSLPDWDSLRRNRNFRTTVASEAGKEIIAAAEEAVIANQHEQAHDLLWPLLEDNDPQAYLVMAKSLLSSGKYPLLESLGQKFLEQAAIEQLPEAFYLFAQQSETSRTRPGLNAFDAYYRGALAGHALCQFNVAKLLEFGDSVPQNKEAAAHYYRLAAAKGVHNAVRALSRFLD